MGSPEKKPDFYHEAVVNTPRSYVWDSIMAKWDEHRQKNESAGELQEGSLISGRRAACSIFAIVTTFEEMKNITLTIDCNKSKFALPLPAPIRSADISLELSDTPDGRMQQTGVRIIGNLGLRGDFIPGVKKGKGIVLSLISPMIHSHLSELGHTAESYLDQSRNKHVS